MKIALGRLGWTEDVFYNSTLRAFLLALEAKDAADQYRQNSLSWQIRNHAFIVAIGYTGKKLKAPAELWPHPWDDGQEAKPAFTEEDLERMKEVFRKWDEIEENGGNS